MATILDFPSLAARIETRIAAGETESAAIFAVCHRGDIDDLLEFAVPTADQTDAEAFLCTILAEVAALSPVVRDYIVECCIERIACS